MGEEPVATFEIDNSRMGGITIACNLWDNTHIFPRPAYTVGHCIGDLLRPLSGICEIVFSIGLVHIGSFGKILQIQRVYFAVYFLHIFIKASIVTSLITPKDIRLSVIIDEYDRIYTCPTVCGAYAILTRKQRFTQNIFIRSFRTIRLGYSYATPVCRWIEIILAIRALHRMTRKWDMSLIPFEIIRIYRDRILCPVYHICSGKHTPVRHMITLLVARFVTSRK